MILSALVWSPLACGLALLLLPRERPVWVRGGALAAGLVNGGLALRLLKAGFLDLAGPELRFTEQFAWLPQWGISYHLGVDGISLYLVLLNALLAPLAVLCSWKAVENRVKEFHFLLLFLQTAVHGVFLALDGFLFYLFWEASLIPMLLLIGVWGGERRLYATVKFVLYTLAGSLFMLLAMLKLAQLCQADPAIGRLSFALSDWKRLSVPVETQRWLFLAFFLAFAIKVPLFPFHTWLPDAHVEAPTAGSVLLAGVLLKLGGYGLMRWCLPVFPEATVLFQTPVVALALVGVLYGAGMVLVQTDFKKMVAYSSVSHMALCVLGLFSLTLAGSQGALLTMVNHGISTGALFIIVGQFYERTHTRDLALYGGASARMPLMGLLFLPVALSSMGVPGTNGFASEFLVLRGAFRYDPLVGALAAGAVVLSAAYMLRLTQNVMYGPLASPAMEHLRDLNLREAATLGALVFLIFACGLFPGLMLRLSEASVNQVLLDVMRWSAPQP